MARKPSAVVELTQRDLSRWRLVEDFRRRLAEAAASLPQQPTWSDPRRLLTQADYLSLFLFGLLNPVVRTMNGLCAASHLPRVQRDICSRPVSLGSFSEAQAVLDAALLAEVFTRLSRQLPSPPQASPRQLRRWLIQDSSLFDALPRMYWALWRRQGKAQSQVRLHLSLEMERNAPVHAQITPGKSCERAAWRRL